MRDSRQRGTDTVRRLRLRGIVVVVLTAGLAISTAAASSIAIRVTPLRGDGVAFRFSQLPPCEAVVANARVLAWLGPEVEVVVRRGPKVVVRGGWLACKDPPRQYQTWDVRPRASRGSWRPAGRGNALTLTAAMSRSGLYRYTYAITVDGNRVRAGRITASVTSENTVRITLR